MSQRAGTYNRIQCRVDESGKDSHPKSIRRRRKSASEAEFGIYARDRIEKNGVVIADAGQLLAKLITDENGMGESSYLPSEAYYLVKELKAPDGYEITEDLKKGCEVYLGNQ